MTETPMEQKAGPADFGKIATALGLFASAIKSGENWTDQCESAKKEAYDALSRIGNALSSRAPQAEGEGRLHSLVCDLIRAVRQTEDHTQWFTPLSAIMQYMETPPEPTPADEPKGDGALRSAKNWLGSQLGHVKAWEAKEIHAIIDLIDAALSTPSQDEVMPTTPVRGYKAQAGIDGHDDDQAVTRASQDEGELRRREREYRSAGYAKHADAELARIDEGELRDNERVRDALATMQEFARLRRALEPFARCAEWLKDDVPNERGLMFASEGGGTFLGFAKVGDLRRASEALSRSPEE